MVHQVSQAGPIKMKRGQNSISGCQIKFILTGGVNSKKVCWGDLENFSAEHKETHGTTPKANGLFFSKLMNINRMSMYGTPIETYIYLCTY